VMGSKKGVKLRGGFLPDQAALSEKSLVQEGEKKVRSAGGELYRGKGSGECA